MLLSVLYVRYRDVQPIWEVLTQILFYASPILYVSTLVDECCQRPYVANPIAAILTQMRNAIIDPTAPSVVDGDRRQRAAADPARDRLRPVRARALGLQPRGAEDRRAPVASAPMATDPSTDSAELAQLRERLDALEREAAERTARANLALAEAQDRSYWLDRWHLDLNALMRRRGASELRAALRATRSVYRSLYDARSRLRDHKNSVPLRVSAAKQAVEEERSLAAEPGAEGERYARTLSPDRLQRRADQRAAARPPRRARTSPTSRQRLTASEAALWETAGAARPQALRARVRRPPRACRCARAHRPARRRCRPQACTRWRTGRRRRAARTTTRT